MSYSQTADSVRPAAILGAVAVPAGFGALLIAGLAVQAVIAPPEDDFIGFQLKPEPTLIPPPPPVPEPVPDTITQRAKTTPTTVVIPRTPTAPKVDIPLGTTLPIDPFGTAGGEIGGDVIPSGVGDQLLPPAPDATPLADPVRAAPRGNPGGWVTDGDYRTRWIREGLSGTARFTLDIDAKGRVSDCTITRSTGHQALDEATCRLLAKRGRFSPARDGNGAKVSGSYSSAISWELPD